MVNIYHRLSLKTTHQTLAAVAHDAAETANFYELFSLHTMRWTDSKRCYTFHVRHELSECFEVTLTEDAMFNWHVRFVCHRSIIITNNKVM